MSNSRDLGISGGAGKGDADRSNRKAFVAGLASIELHPENREGFTLVRTGRWTKRYPTASRAAVRKAAGFSTSTCCSSDR